VYLVSYPRTLLHQSQLTDPVGGTSGNGEATARSFVRNAIAPRVYLIGRNEAQASKIIQELNALNPESRATFLKCDVSLLKKVDEVCKDIQEMEEKVNVLVLTTGMMTYKGRDETNEGLDKKLSLHYYARMRFIANLLPQLNAAANSPPSTSARATEERKPRGLASVVSVLEAGGEAQLIQDDLSLKSNYSLANARTHAITMTSLSLTELAQSNPSISFTHSFPGVVKTGVIRELGLFGRTIARAGWALARPWMVPIEESGERHLFAAVDQRGEAGKPYLVGSDSEPRGNWNLLEEFKAKKVGEDVWRHTLNVFEEICG
jgi:NAD(P)-dependent dehydrogenase (short-subunit alcohol dehydrogenase family)